MAGGYMGKLLFVDTADELWHTILQLRDDPALREKMTQVGFQEVHRYDWVNLGDQYRKILQHIIER